jgi:hypothetical protein
VQRTNGRGALSRGQCSKLIETVGALWLFALVYVSLAPTAIASVSTLTWTGASGTPSWSAIENWEGGTVPSGSTPVALGFPRLPGCVGTCYRSRNDVSGQLVESLIVDDGDEYTIEGEEIVLGAEGLVAFPQSGSSGPAGDIFKLPIALEGAQTWSVFGRGNFAENGILVDGGLTGSSSPLTLDVGGAPLVYLASNAEVGSVAIDGTEKGRAGVFNGAVDLRGVQLNSQDGNSVVLNHVFLFGSGTLGPLTTETAELGVGNGSFPTGGIEASSATFDGNSEVDFQIAGAGTRPGVDYSQLSAHGEIQLGGASLIVALGPPSSGESCPSLTPGQLYTLVSTKGSLAGVFGNAPEGSELPVTFAKACGTREVQDLRIEYHESGATQTVTATVQEIPLPIPPKYYNAYERPNAEGATWGPISSARAVAEATAARKAKEEAEAKMRAAAAAKIPTGEVSLAGAGITVQGDGVALVKLDCVGSVSCAGKLTLSATSTAKGKRQRSRTVTIGTDVFLAADGNTTIAHVKLNEAGRKLLASAHQRLAARLEIQKLTPAPEQKQIANVHLALRRPTVRMGSHPAI